MGRPQIHHTLEEKKAANRLKSKKHYERNRDIILRQRRRIARQKRKSEKNDKIAQSMGEEEVVPLERSKSKLDIIKDQVQRISQRFERALAERSTAGYLSLVCVGFEIHYEEGYVTRAKDFIMEKEVEFRKIRCALEKYQGMVEEIAGFSEEWKEIEGTVARVREVVRWLDSVLCTAMVDPADLVNRFRAKQLEFQTGSEV
ncbi:hypothetical protein H1R20_g1111, partial [Candolleomyces eurysporus]